MAAPFDFSKLRKEHNKKHKVRDGFNDPITWISTGNYALNKMISGDFRRGIPIGAVSVFAGESGASKSYIVSGNIVRDALAQGVFVVLLDTEDALKTQWMRNLGVDPDHGSLVKYVKSTVNNIAEIINDFTKEYRIEHANTPREQQPKILFVVDSLGFVETDAETDQWDKGELKGDKGIKAKSLKMLVANCIRLFAGYEIGLVATNHTYKSQDMYNPDDVISGGSGFIFAASIIVSMTKKKLKAEDSAEVEKGARRKPKDTLGIIAKIKCVKTRYSKPFEEVEVAIPYSTGMDPYSGLFDMFESGGLLVKEGNRYVYRDRSGTEHKMFRKEIGPKLYDLIISEYVDSSATMPGVDEIGGQDETEDGDVG